MNMTLEHRPVLCDEAMRALAIRPEGCYVDATFGRGGHAELLLAALGGQGRLLALDRDPAAAACAARRFTQELRLRFSRVPFSHLAEVVSNHAPNGRVDGVLMDLGVSSPQLDDPQRGFSFRHDGPLDMRMDPETGISAADWLATVAETELASVLRDYGEERYYRRIARAIVHDRQQAPFMTTRQLAGLIERVVPTRETGQHPATRSFQAIRIAVNRELEELSSALGQAVEVLNPGGRLVVISFHSLEDRLVKRHFRREVRGPEWPPDLPIPAHAVQARLRLIGKPQRPSAAECAANPRSRSAVLRVAERLP